jgi:putative transposase
MPEHVHLLISEPARATLADALKSLKQGVSRRLIGEANHFWQKRYYDFNIRDRQQFAEKLQYIHRNPVKRGLCQRIDEWEWSSCPHYATGSEGRVEIESEWTAKRRNASTTIRLDFGVSGASCTPHFRTRVRLCKNISERSNGIQFRS